MRIKKIIVKNLFGLFNHDIPFNLDKKITIIFGPNGFGKTIILKFIDGFFNQKFGIIESIPFSEFRIEFESGDEITIFKKIDDNGKEKMTINIKKDDVTKELPYTRLTMNDLEISSTFIERFMPVNRIDFDSWIYMPTGEKLSTEELFERYGREIIDKLPIKDRKKIIYKRMDKLFKEVGALIPVHLIETQRLLTLHRKQDRHDRFSEVEYQMISAVDQYSKDLTRSIESLLAKSAELSQSLDRTFPVRLMKTKISKEVTNEELQDQLSKLEEIRNHLRDLGLLGKVAEELQIQEIDEDAKKVLSVYIQDVKDKLKIFEELAGKIDILKRIINDHFLYKKMAIDKEKGFVFRDNNDKIITPSKLSSGEQHELVLLYELLFKVEPNSLILIDEPEISLHVAWQRRFLNDIQEISNIRNLDILIATHSPSIINDQMDYTVELKGIEG